MSKSVDEPQVQFKISVGEVLGRELDAQGWSQADLAAVLGRPTQFVSEIINGKKEITRESAAQIGAAFDHTPEYWLNLQDQYLLAKQADDAATQVKLDAVRRRARLNSKGPIELLKKRGFLSGESLVELEAGVMDLFELATLDDEPGFAAAARRANPHEETTTLQRAWVACVRSESRRLPPIEKYSPKRLRRLAANLTQTLKLAKNFADLPERFAEVGVRLVHVESFPGAKIDGCAMFVDGYPVIGLSGRGKRLDKVLFTLLHEVGHVLLEHVDDSSWIVELLDQSEDQESDQENQANRQASRFAFPDGFPVVPARVGRAWVEQTAADLSVAQIVIVGQLQHRDRLDWRTTLAKNAPAVGDALQSWK